MSAATIRMPQGEWLTEAVCASTDPDAFFPEVGQSVATVKAICRRCPVIAECLDWALSTGEPHGIWGGLTVAERNGIRRAERIGHVA